MEKYSFVVRPVKGAVIWITMQSYEVVRQLETCATNLLIKIIKEKVAKNED